MTFVFRAAGSAATAVALIVTATFAGPSLAFEAQAAPATSSFFDNTAIEGFAPAQPEQQAIAVAVVPEAVAAPNRSLSEMVSDHSATVTAGAEHECLAGAVYFEAKGEPLAGQLTVAEVVINRANSGRFPASICGVVKQRGQFSFIRTGRFPPIARGTLAWRKAVAIARIAMDELADGAAPRALFFHATYVAPRWRGLTRIATVGNHVFYR